MGPGLGLGIIDAEVMFAVSPVNTDVGRKGRGELIQFSPRQHQPLYLGRIKWLLSAARQLPPHSLQGLSKSLGSHCCPPPLLLSQEPILGHGSTFVRHMFVVVVIALILKTGYDAFLR